MELKLRGRCENRICFSVLIVPYGIETYIPVMNKIAIIVLIVPYGIETVKLDVRYSFVPVLIVPYGIETHTWQLASIFLSEC